MKILVCGSRSFTDKYLVFATLAQYLPDVEIVTGMAQGPDLWGWQFAKKYDLPVYEYPAKWETYGKSAGFRRNEEMIKSGPDLVLAFWDGISRGTKHTITLAHKYNIPIIIFTVKL